MEITEVKVFLVDEEKLKAFVSIVLDRCFMINDIKVIQGREGLFISMPSRRKKNGDFKDVAHPLNNETRRWMEGVILAEYERVREQRPAVAVATPIAARRPVTPAPALAAAADEAVTSGGGEAVPPAEPVGDDKSLEEVQQHHMSDSYWSVS